MKFSEAPAMLVGYELWDLTTPLQFGGEGERARGGGVW